MSLTWRTIDLDRGDHGVRVDLVLLRHLRRDERGISRNRIQKWIDVGDVLVNGAPPSRASWRVQAGDAVQVRLQDLQPRARQREIAVATRHCVRHWRAVPIDGGNLGLALCKPEAGQSKSQTERDGTGPQSQRCHVRHGSPVEQE